MELPLCHDSAAAVAVSMSTTLPIGGWRVVKSNGSRLCFKAEDAGTALKLARYVFLNIIDDESRSMDIILQPDMPGTTIQRTINHGSATVHVELSTCQVRSSPLPLQIKHRQLDVQLDSSLVHLP